MNRLAGGEFKNPTVIAAEFASRLSTVAGVLNALNDGRDLVSGRLVSMPVARRQERQCLVGIGGFNYEVGSYQLEEPLDTCGMGQLKRMDAVMPAMDRACDRQFSQVGTDDVQDRPWLLDHTNHNLGLAILACLDGDVAFSVKESGDVFRCHGIEIIAPNPMAIERLAQGALSLEIGA